MATSILRKLTAPFRVPRPDLISRAFFILTVGATAAASLYAVINVRDHLAAYSGIAHSQETLIMLAKTRDVVERQNATSYAYILTGDQKTLDEYHKTMTSTGLVLDGLDAWAEADPALKPGIEELEVSLRQHFRASEDLVEKYRYSGFEAARATIAKEDADLRTGDGVRNLLSGMEEQERALLTTQETEAKASLIKGIIGAALALAFYVFIQCVVFSRMDRESARRQKAEAAINVANSDLEKSLVEQTRHNAMSKGISLLGEILQSCRDVDEVVTITFQQIGHFLPNLTVDIGLFRNSRDIVEYFRRADTGEHLIGASSRNLTPDACWALRRGRSHSYSGGGYDPRCRHAEGEGLHTFCVPMLGHGETLGVLSLYSNEPEGISASDQSTAQKIAERLALALANLKLQETLRNKSVRDALTGLFNRRYLDESLTRELARAARHGNPVSVMMLDVDHFKRFNDTFGHEGGDQVLSQFGQLLEHSVRGEDIACRYGGEEFVLVLPGATHEAALKRANEICAATRRMNVSLRGMAMDQITVSIGVATYPTQAEDVTDLLAAADTALYEAKGAGRDCVVSAISKEATAAAAEEDLGAAKVA